MGPPPKQPGNAGTLQKSAYNKDLYTNAKVPKSQVVKNNKGNKPVGNVKGYKLKVAKPPQANRHWDPRAQEILKVCVDEWKQYSSKIAYTNTGRIAYISPLDLIEEVDYYDPTDIPDDSISVIAVGKRRTGKSHLIKDLCKCWGVDMKRFEEIYVFTKTAINDWYQQWIPQQYIYDGWQKEKAEIIWERAMMKTWLKRKHNIGKGANILVICDDLLSDSRAHKYDPTLLAFYTAGRHVGITIIYITQKFKGTVPEIRDNSDLVFSFNMFNQNEARQLAEEFLGGLNIRTAMELQDLYANQNKHSCLVVETWRNNRDPAMYLKYYAAEEETELKIGDIGSKEYIRIAAELQAKQEAEEDEARSRDVEYPAKRGWDEDHEDGDKNSAAAFFNHLRTISRS